MNEYPQFFYMASGKGKSSFELVSFDNALLDAGISNYNLLKISSILPARCQRKDSVEVKEGSPLLTAFATVSSDKEGEQLATAVGIGIPKNKDKTGLIMEHGRKGISEQEARDIVENMVKEAMENHGTEIETILISSMSETVSSDGFVSLISAVAIW